MIKAEGKILDDLLRMAGGTVGLVSNLREEIQTDIKERVDAMASRMDLVPREDFERLEAQVAALQKQIDDLTTKTKKAKK